MKSFNDFNRIQKITIVGLCILAASTIIWICIALLAWLLTHGVSKDWTGFCSIIFSKNGGWYFLATLGTCCVFVAYIFFRYHKKLGGKIFDKDKQIDKADYSVKWLPQSELEKNIVVLKDEIQSTYPTWTIEGINGVKDSKGRSVTDITYNILAVDRFCLLQKFKNEKREPFINGGKDIKKIIAGATITIGAGRSGKTQQVIKPTILHLLDSKTKCSMVICDLKGDIYKMTSNLAIKRGYDVRRFNTTNSKFSHSWNTLGEIWDLYYNEYLPNWERAYQIEIDKKKQPEEMDSYSDFRNKYLDAKSKIQTKLDIIVKTIAPVTEGTREPFFEKSAQNLIKLYFLLPLDYGINKEDYNMFNVSSNAITYKEKLVILNDMLPLWALSKIYSVQFYKTEGRTSIQDVQSTVDMNLETFTIQEIKNLTTPNDTSISFENFVNKPTIIYISIDVTTKDSSANRLAVLFMEMLYTFLQSYLTKKNLPYFENPILFIVDEFGNLPKMEYMLRMFSLDQGKNIIPHLVLQSPAQLNRKYGKEDRKELFDSTQCFILCSGVDTEFAQWLSDRSGTDYRHVQSKNITDEGKVSHSVSKTKMENIPKGEFTNIRPNEEIVLVPIGLRPCKITITPADKVKWIKETTNQIDLANDVAYGGHSHREVDFINHVLYPEIVNLWIYRNNDEKVSKIKMELAKELSQMPLYSGCDDVTPADSYRLNNHYKKYGSYPTLALSLIGFTDKNNNSSELVAESLKKDDAIYNNVDYLISKTNSSMAAIKKKIKAFNSVSKLDKVGWEAFRLSQWLSYCKNRKLDQITMPDDWMPSHDAWINKIKSDPVVSKFLEQEVQQDKKIEKIDSKSLSQERINALWAENSFKVKIKNAKFRTFDKNIIQNGLGIKEIHIKSLIFLLPILGIDKIEPRFKNEKAWNNVIDAIKNDKKYGNYWNLANELPTPETTVDELVKKYDVILNADICDENIFYIVKLIDLLIFAYQNSEEAQTPGIDTIQEAWEVVKTYFKIPTGELMKHLYGELKRWWEENYFGTENND